MEILNYVLVDAQIVPKEYAILVFKGLLIIHSYNFVFLVQLTVQNVTC